MKSITLPKKSTNCVTLRIPSENLSRLRKVSETKNITPNTLVNQIVKTHLDWHSMAQAILLAKIFSY